MSNHDELLPPSCSCKHGTCKVCLVEAPFDSGSNKNLSSARPHIKVGINLNRLPPGYKNGLHPNENVSIENNESSKSAAVFKEPLVPVEGGICLKNQLKIVKNGPNAKIIPSLNYTQPSWGCCPPLKKIFKLTEIKNGVIVKEITLVKPFYSLGRHKCCDIVLMHDSVSRNHAVLQYGSPSGDSYDEGYYVYDTGSSNGVTVNNKSIEQKRFVRLKGGYILKIAFSTRFFVIDILNRVTCLDSDEERAEDGINWGQAEDAAEALDPCPNFNYFASELELKDSMKTSKKRSNSETFKTNNIIQHCSVGISSKESLDSSEDVLNHTACGISCNRNVSISQFNKQPCRNWEETDYYDDEEDPFFDQTGELEKKRQKRQMKGNKDNVIVYNQETLLQDLTRLFRTRSLLNIIIDKTNRELLDCVSRDDDLEEEVVVKNITENSLLQKLTKLNVALNKIDEDIEHVSKIFRMVQPTHHERFVADIVASVSLDSKALSGDKLSSLEANLGISVHEDFRELFSQASSCTMKKVSSTNNVTEL